MRGGQWTLVIACAGLAAGCVSTAARQDLAVDYQTAWPVVQRVMAAHTTIAEQAGRPGTIVGFTSPERTALPAPGIAGQLFGVERVQTVRRRVTARLIPTDGTSTLSVAATIQRYDPTTDATMARLGHDPADYGRAPPPDAMPPADRWIDVRRDPALQTSILEAVTKRLQAP